jgi:hypothetical protein
MALSSVTQFPQGHYPPSRRRGQALRTVFFACFATASPVPAATESMDKRQFHLFNPTPAAHLRELSTDRPDKTESAYTVDAGHFQVEMDLVTFERDHDTAAGADVVTESWAVSPVNLKVGLLNNLDFQLVLETYNHVRTQDRVSGTTTTQRGFGDVTPRLKWNLWGNDEGATALAAMPFVKFPSNQDHLGNNAVEGGIIFPLAVDLGRGFGLGMITQFDFVQNSDNSRYHPEFINTVTLGHDIIGRLGGYVEFWSLVSTESGSEWQGTVDLGLTYGLTDNVQLDAGVNLGVTRSAPDVQPFLGLSFRF